MQPWAHRPPNMAGYRHQDTCCGVRKYCGNFGRSNPARHWRSAQERACCCTSSTRAVFAAKRSKCPRQLAQSPTPWLMKPGANWGGHFGLVMAFEVLEHIEHDLDALRTWRSWLRPGGTLLLSVPCHMRKWNPSDVWAGHIRRYERAALAELARSAGFEVERILCYGFPLANLAEKVRARSYAPEVDETTDTTTQGKHDNSARSGIDRRHVMKWYPLLRSPLGKLGLRGADLAQRPFLGGELGN